jgi:hypothetical protein
MRIESRRPDPRTAARWRSVKALVVAVEVDQADSAAHVLGQVMEWGCSILEDMAQSRLKGVILKLDRSCRGALSW